MVIRSPNAGAHLQLNRLQATLMPDISYQQPIYVWSLWCCQRSCKVSVEELKRDFEAIPLAARMLRSKQLFWLRNASPEGAISCACSC